MPDISFNNVGISGIAAAVPATRVDNLDAGAPFTRDDVKAIVDKTGIRYRHIADSGTCASDLCFASADHLIHEMGIERDSINAIVFVSQTPDYRMPATAIILQNRLGLSKHTMAFDVNLGCSGFVFGLSLAYSMLSGNGMRRVLLLNGETRSRAYSQHDRATGLLFGDAGSAVLIEHGANFGNSYFSMYSDGGRFEHIIIRAGGYRFPSSAETLEPIHYDDGSIRHAEHGVMQGSSVFEFLLMEVPKSIKQTMNFADVSITDIDFYLFHQANLFMNEHLRRRMKIPENKTPYSLHDYGNTSSVSIPLTMVAELGVKLTGDKHRLLLSGFGVGLSWGNAIIDISNLNILPLIKVPGAIAAEY